SKALSLPSIDNTTDFRGSDFHCGNLPLLEFSLQLIISSSRTGRRPTKVSLHSGFGKTHEEDPRRGHVGICYSIKKGCHCKKDCSVF
ncbi:hypothetical protein U1Q18_032225, partial [Sarracenia purpurea var. burkii]